MKRIVDVVGALIGIFLLLPIMAVIAIVVLVSLGRPVFFRQVRPGFREKPFTIIKFRTMTNKYDEMHELLPDEERLPRLGQLLRKTSLDELPELLNVLRGEMSFVGPRPLLMEYVPKYNEFQRRRHEVHPGMTGWAQINGRNTISWEQKFALDVWYVDHWTLWLDLKILIRTIKKISKREGISSEGVLTVVPFAQDHGYLVNAGDEADNWTRQ